MLPFCEALMSLRGDSGNEPCHHNGVTKDFTDR